MANRSRLPVRQGKRAVTWSSIITRMNATAVGGAKVTGTGIGLSVGLSATLIRSRGLVQVHFDPTSIGDVFLFGIGLAIYSSDAFATGQAAMPGPLSDAGYDWIWYQTMLFGPAFAAAETGTNIVENMWIDLDSKAMRKRKDAQTLGWICEGNIISGGGSVDIGLSCRHLFKFN